MTPPRTKTARRRRKATPAESPPPTAAPAVDDEIYAFADELSQPAPEIAPLDAKLETWVTFVLADNVFALPVTALREIVRVPEITPVPHAPQPIRGIANVRGRVVPVVDLRARMGLNQRPADAESRVLLAVAKQRLLGLFVDGVRQVTTLNRATVRPAPPDVMTEQSVYIVGICELRDELVILLDVERVLAMPTLRTKPLNENRAVTTPDGPA